MSYTVDEERFKKIAEELGLKIVFDSNNPGISFPNQNKHLSWSEVREDIFDLLQITKSEK